MRKDTDTNRTFIQIHKILYPQKKIYFYFYPYIKKVDYQELNQNRNKANNHTYSSLTLGFSILVYHALIAISLSISKAHKSQTMNLPPGNKALEEPIIATSKDKFLEGNADLDKGRIIPIDYCHHLLLRKTDDSTGFSLVSLYVNLKFTGKNVSNSLCL